MEITVKERLKELLKDNEIKDSNFCRMLNVSQGYISGMRMSIQPEKLKSIAINYPTWNIGWLLTGEGNKYLEINTYIPKYNENLLQHYTKADGLIGILKDMKIKFSLQKKSNDIKERRLFFHDEIKNLKNRERKEKIKNYKWISFFTKDENRAVRNPKMFDLYADFHKGGCIEFNKEKLIKKNSVLKLNFYSVKYDDFFLNQKETIKDELEYKYYEWKNENEQRIIYNGEEQSIDITDCIERIYLGCSFFEDKLKVAELCEVIEERNIPINLISQINVSGIGFLDEYSPNKISIGNGIHVAKLLPYLSERYREKHKIEANVEFKKINYKEEKHYKDQNYELLEENRELNKENKDLRITIDELKDKIHTLEKKPAQPDLDATDAKQKIGS